MDQYFLIVVLDADDSNIPGVHEVYIYRCKNPETSEADISKEFRMVFENMRREYNNKKYTTKDPKMDRVSIDMYQVKKLQRLPFFVNERAIPLCNFWPMSESGDAK